MVKWSTEDDESDFVLYRINMNFIPIQLYTLTTDICSDTLYTKSEKALKDPVMCCCKYNWILLM